MQMSEVLDKLKSLQDVLAEKYDIQNKVEELPRSLDGSTESLDRFKKEYIEKNKEYEDKKIQVAQLKNDLDEASKAREAGEKGMDAIQTHREYEILDKQINEAKEREDSIRKELLKEEKALSELKDILDSEEALIETTENDVNESKSSLERELAGYNEQIASLTAQENEMSEGIDPEIVFKFQRIIQRNRKGIVAVRGNVCDGCHMILPAQFANEIHRGEKILFCPYCSRILFYEETADNDSSFFSLDEAGSLSDLDEDLLGEDLEENEGLEGNDEDDLGEVTGTEFDD